MAVFACRIVKKLIIGIVRDIYIVINEELVNYPPIGIEIVINTVNFNLIVW